MMPDLKKVKIKKDKYMFIYVIFFKDTKNAGLTLTLGCNCTTGCLTFYFTTADC